ncbi:ABC transporter substrate-binding protein [candidate division TA06 bacterium]|nr:ABC transporter substrate-binding protein [candidate division TA06 bacterium]
MKRLSSIILLLILTGGCGSKRQEDISLWHVMGGPLGQTLDSLITGFGREHPGQRIKGVSMGSYTALSQKLMASVAAGNQPEMSQSYEAWTTQLLEKGAIKPFGDFIKPGEADDSLLLSDIYPVMLEECSRDGKLVSLPFNKSVPIYYYNKDLFAKAGLNPEKFPENWEQFIAAARKLTIDRDGNGIPEQWGTAFPSGASWMFQCLLLQNGGDIFGPDSQTAAFDSPQGIEALQYLVDLLYKYKVAYLTTGFEHQNDFLSGRVAMIQSSSASLAYMAQQKIPFNLGIAPLPGKKRKAVVLSGTNVIMFRQPEQKAMERCWDFMNWFLSPAQTARWSANTSYLPVRRSAFKEPVLRNKFAKYPGMEQAYLQLEFAYPEPRQVAWFLGRSIMEEEGLQPALKGVMTPAQALHHAAKRVNQQSGVNSYSPWLNWTVFGVIMTGLALLAIRKHRLSMKK